MRTEMNPNADKIIDFEPARVTAVVVVHIPHLGGYYSGMLDVLDRCLNSIRASQTAFDLLIHSNGCCDAAHKVIMASRPDYVIRTRRNQGAINALFQAVRAAPGNIIAYSDYDVEFLPNWLNPQIEILDTFDAGMVSGNPAGWSAENMNRSAKGLSGKWIPRKYADELRHANSLGWSASTLEQRLAATDQRKRDHWLTERNGVRAIVGARHYQFIAYRERLLEIDPSWHNEKMRGHVAIIDQAIDRRGWLRLNTTTPFVWHLGNQLDDIV